MALDSPDGRHCTAPTAVPMLNSAAEPRKRAGLSAPVSTMVLLARPESTLAVATIESEPWVTNTCRAACAPMVSRISSRSWSVRCRLSLRRIGMMLKRNARSEEHTSELQSLMRISYAVFCLKKKKTMKIKIPSQNSTHQQYNRNEVTTEHTQ